MKTWKQKVWCFHFHDQYEEGIRLKDFESGVYQNVNVLLNGMMSTRLIHEHCEVM
jgi:hypothetical protein